MPKCYRFKFLFIYFLFFWHKYFYWVRNAFNWLKVTVKFSYKNKHCSFELYIHKTILKNVSNCFHKTIKQHNHFWKVMRKLMFLQHYSSAYYNDFWRNMWHWKWLLKIKLCHHRNKYIFDPINAEFVSIRDFCQKHVGNTLFYSVLATHYTYLL